ncbi:hypothetical protein WJX73_008950 [Symbiochloris irregularis]|uniref:Uncharacterized protein n=1 Tax=Symbiochloris irregularis TaxID=706552 RepID=A0AAW1PLJ8_9CHLO
MMLAAPARLQAGPTSGRRLTCVSRRVPGARVPRVVPRAESIGDKAKEAISSAKDAFKGLFGGAEDALRDVEKTAGDLANNAEDGFDSATRKAKRGLNDADSEAGSLGSKAGSKVDQAKREGKDLLNEAERRAKKLSE